MTISMNNPDEYAKKMTPSVTFQFIIEYLGSERAGSLSLSRVELAAREHPHVSGSGRFWRNLARAHCPVRPIAAATAQGRSTLAQLPERFRRCTPRGRPDCLIAQQIFLRTVISGEDNVRSLREFPPVDPSPPSPSDGIAIMAINYLILLSRQGKVVCCPPSLWAPFRLAAQT